MTKEQEYLSDVVVKKKGKRYDLQMHGTLHPFISVEFNYDELVAGLVEWHLRCEPFDIDEAFADEEWIKRLEQQQGGKVSRERAFEMYKEHVTGRMQLIADNYQQNIDKVIGQMATPLMIEAPAIVFREIDRNKGNLTSSNKKLKSRARSARWQLARQWLDVNDAGRPVGRKNKPKDTLTLKQQRKADEEKMKQAICQVHNETKLAVVSVVDACKKAGVSTNWFYNRFTRADFDKWHREIIPCP